jgi:hypothetical protein
LNVEPASPARFDEEVFKQSKVAHVGLPSDIQNIADKWDDANDCVNGYVDHLGQRAVSSKPKTSGCYTHHLRKDPVTNTEEPA